MQEQDKEQEQVSHESGDFVEINADVSIPMAELSFRFARSGGPGGQHVNKTETKVILSFNVAQSPSLSSDVRRLLLERLASRLDKDGVLQLSAQSSRSQMKNKLEAISRFQAVLAGALIVQKKRKPTRPSKRAKARRVDAKKKRGQRKKERSQKWDS
jgi:ribosome-associated protein